MAYTEVDESTFLRRNEQSQSRSAGGDFGDWWKMKIGPQGKPERAKIRLMPPHENMEKDPFLEVLMHFLPSKEIGKDGRPIPIGLTCLGDKRWQEECLVCSHVARLRALAKNEDEPEAAERLEKKAKDEGAKMRFFCNIVDQDHPDKGVQRYACGVDVEKKIRACFFNDDGEYRNITHPKNGRNVILTAQFKKGNSGFPEYAAKPGEEATALKDLDWLDGINDLTKEIRKTTEAEIRAALKGERLEKKGAKAETKAEAKTETKSETKVESKKEEVVVAEKKKEEAVVVETKPKRQPITEDGDADPYANARAACKKAGFANPAEIDPAAVEGLKKPNCFTKEADPADAMCQGCRVLLPCLTAKLAAA